MRNLVVAVIIAGSVISSYAFGHLVGEFHFKKSVVVVRFDLIDSRTYWGIPYFGQCYKAENDIEFCATTTH